MRDMERKRRMDRERMRRKRAERRRDPLRWYREQLANPTPPPAWTGVTLEQHLNWCRHVLSLPTEQELGALLNLSQG
jgi:hypothetical protein